MRRTRPAFALALALITALGLGGCASLDSPYAVDRPGRVPSAEDRPPVPDAVMLRDQVGSLYRDSPVP